MQKIILFCLSWLIITYARTGHLIIPFSAKAGIFKSITIMIAFKLFTMDSLEFKTLNVTFLEFE